MARGIVWEIRAPIPWRQEKVHAIWAVPEPVKIPIALVLSAVTIILALVYDRAEVLIILNMILGSAFLFLP